MPDSSPYYIQQHEPPTPTDPGTRARWDETRRRRRLLDGSWRDDLLERYADHMGLGAPQAHVIGVAFE